MSITLKFYGGAQMRISMIMNDISTPPLTSEHGLSLFIETNHHNILFDMGKSNLFMQNAAMMKLDISKVDVAILSHGHYDHGGGLPHFMEKNSRASIYIHQEAFGKHYAYKKSGGVRFIGIPSEPRGSKRIIFTQDEHKINDNLLLFSDVCKDRFVSKFNDVLLVECLQGYHKDPFMHEQNLLIQEDGKRVLIAGCAHNGIVNILDKATRLADGPIDAVIGGFHLSNPGTGECECCETIEGIAKCLLSFPANYYTCHCTGMEAYNLLKEKMQDNISYVSAGEVIEI